MVIKKITYMEKNNHNPGSRKKNLSPCYLIWRFLDLSLIRRILKQKHINKVLLIRKKFTRGRTFRENLREPSKSFKVIRDPLWEEMKKQNFTFPEDNPLKNNPFHYTQQIFFELSNLCNYSRLHGRCPLHHERGVRILPLHIIQETIDVLSKHRFEGTIAFHNYNEPLIDPRLFHLLKYAREKCPKSEIYIYTNGFYLDQTILDELVAFGLSRIHVSIYSMKELKRIKKIYFPISYELEVVGLDDTLEAYSKSELNLKKKCFAPLGNVIITRDAEISLCCFDWAHVYTFGNLKEQPLDEILRSDFLYAVYKKLSNGERFLDVCKRCRRSVGKKDAHS